MIVCFLLVSNLILTSVTITWLLINYISEKITEYIAMKYYEEIKTQYKKKE